MSLAGEAGAAAVHLLEHPRVPFISYPYEWSASLLRKAALHHLDTQLEALERGFTLSDATAYNVQFVGPKPVFIDHLSFRPYRDGEIWAGHRQFCMQFLNPLIIWSRLGIAPNPWYRGNSGRHRAGGPGAADADCATVSAGPSHPRNRSSRVAAPFGTKRHRRCRPTPDSEAAQGVVQGDAGGA